MGIASDEIVIWIVDSDHWPRAYLRAELIERGFDAVGYEQLSQALADLHSAKPRIMILELRDQPVKAEELMVIKQTGIPIIALTGSAEWSAPHLREFPWTAVLHRPFTIGDVADLVQEFTQRRST